MDDARIAHAGTGDAAGIARLHGRLFDPSWDETAVTQLMQPPAAVALLAVAAPAQTSSGAAPEAVPSPLLGFLLARIAADEAEVLSLGVAPQCQRHGLARRLLAALRDELQGKGAKRLFLEVAADNTPAVGLYLSFGFREVGRRRAYYARRGAAAADAVVLALALQASG
jgi:ribosomal-protein-alanine N-acetyltransferase